MLVYPKVVPYRKGRITFIIGYGRNLESGQTMLVYPKVVVCRDDHTIFIFRYACTLKTRSLRFAPLTWSSPAVYFSTL